MVYQMTCGTVEAMKNLKGLPYGGAGSVTDPDMLDQVTGLMSKSRLAAWLQDDHIHHVFVARYRDWILSSRLNDFGAIASFPIGCYSNGTSEAFDKFYLRNHGRRFRCFQGEYMYHAASWRNYFPQWCRIEQDEIRSNDAVVMSLPFSDTGTVHPFMNDVLKQCNRLGVPVLLDCAFFGICQEIRLDCDLESVTDITFSLSKSFPVANLRIGLRLTRQDDDDSLLVHHKTNYVNRVGAGVAIELMERFSPDYNCDRWRSQQHAFCQELDLTPSDTVIFGIDNKNHFPEYSRGGSSNRICFAKYFSQGHLPHD